MLFLLIKFLHILSSTILFGTGIGTASVMVYGHYTKDVHVIAAINRYVVLADWIFTGTSGIIQPLTGFALIALVGYPLLSPWIIGSIFGYLVAAACWFPVVYLQIKMRNYAITAQAKQTPLPPEYYSCFRYWFCLGWPAFISLIIVFYLMTTKPM